MNALIESPKTHNGAVEQILDREGLDYSLQQLPHTVLAQTDDKMFQTRPSSGDDEKTIVNDNHVDQLCESISKGYALSAVVLFLFNGKYITCDGRHRLAAYRKINFKGDFSAYVIENLTEGELFEKGKKLSCLLNDINGERAGQTNEAKSKRLVTLDEASRQLYKIYPRTIPAYNDIKKHCDSWNLGDNSVFTMKEKYFLLRLKVVCAESEFAFADYFRQSDSEVLFKLIARTEPNKRKDLLDTVYAAMKQGGKSSVSDALKKHEENSLPISTIIDNLQIEFCLNSDNTDKSLPMRAATKYKSDVIKSCQMIIGLLKSSVPVFGDDKDQVDNVLKKLQKACDQYLSCEEQ